MTGSRFTVSTEVSRGEVVITNCLAGVLNEDGNLDGYPIRALWDTVATDSAISKKIADRLNIEYVCHHDVDTANGASTSLPRYRNVCFMLTADGLIARPKAVDVIDFQKKDEEGNDIDVGFDAIIGLDIISCGRFTLEPVDDGLGTRMTFIYDGE